MDISQDFLEKIILLAVTAVITGFGVPFVLKRIEERKLRAQEIIKAQSKLLDDLSEVVWKWRYLAKKVVYYAGEKSEDRFEMAKQNYDESVWDILHQLRIEISRSRRLVSEDAYKDLRTLYGYIVYDLDSKISKIIKRDKLDAETIKESSALSDRFTTEVSQKIDDFIDRLASEIGLKVKT